MECHYLKASPPDEFRVLDLKSKSHKGLENAQFDKVLGYWNETYMYKDWDHTVEFLQRYYASPKSPSSLTKDHLRRCLKFKENSTTDHPHYH